jgi:hypothetical protein
MNKNLKKTLIGLGVGAIVGTSIVIFALPAIGFGAVGVTAGSIAAITQSSIGAIATGSTFAVLQSAGAVGITGATSAVIVGSAATGGAIVGASASLGEDKE